MGTPGPRRPSVVGKTSSSTASFSLLGATAASTSPARRRTSVFEAVIVRVIVLSVVEEGRRRMAAAQAMLQRWQLVRAMPPRQGPYSADHLLAARDLVGLRRGGSLQKLVRTVAASFSLVYWVHSGVPLFTRVHLLETSVGNSTENQTKVPENVTTRRWQGFGAKGAPARGGRAKGEKLFKDPGT